MKNLFNLLNRFLWALYRLTPAGKRAYMFKKAERGLKISVNLKKATKMSVVHSAYNSLKQKKILAFSKGRSVAKSKKSDHQVIHQVKHVHRNDLERSGLKVDPKGKFKNT